MLMRKVPGFVPASPWGLRLPQKFLFLLFLSGLITLCFGALFPAPLHLTPFTVFTSTSLPYSLPSGNH